MSSKRTPQPGDRATVELEVVEKWPLVIEVRWPNGETSTLMYRLVAGLDWQPPPPPPWVPEVGKMATAGVLGQVRVLAIDGEEAWLDHAGYRRTGRLSDLSPPKGEAQ